MEEHYGELLGVLRSTDCVTAFQLAEANQKTFPSNEVFTKFLYSSNKIYSENSVQAVRVAKAMSTYLKEEEEQRECFVKTSLLGNVF